MWQQNWVCLPNNSESENHGSPASMGEHPPMRGWKALLPPTYLPAWLPGTPRCTGTKQAQSCPWGWGTWAQASISWLQRLHRSQRGHFMNLIFVNSTHQVKMWPLICPTKSYSRSLQIPQKHASGFPTSYFLSYFVWFQQLGTITPAGKRVHAHRRPLLKDRTMRPSPLDVCQTLSTNQRSKPWM